MNILTVDLETYYDNEFSLSKLSTEQYVRDPRFEVILMGYKLDDGPTQWCQGADIAKLLDRIDFSDKAILCHNTAFDGAILSWHYGVKPKLWLDTLSMAKPYHNVVVGGSLAKLAAYYRLGVKGTEVIKANGKHLCDFSMFELASYAGYCMNDVELTYKLFKKLKSMIPPNELVLIDQLIRMFTEPCFDLDIDLLTRHLNKVVSNKEELLSKLTVSKDELMSNQKFAEVLKSLGVDPPTKTSLKTGKEAWAFSKTDQAFLDLQNHPDEQVQAVVAARLGVKSTLEETRTRNLIEIGKRGPLPIMLKYYGAQFTGRMSGADGINPQNFPARGNNTIRRSMRAPKGYVFVVGDSSQIEARKLAYVAGQWDLVQAFRDKRDPYCEFATDVYGRGITKEDKPERFVGKTCILGLGYGTGGPKLRSTLKIGQAGINVEIDEGEAVRIVKLYRGKYPMIVQLWRSAELALRAMVLEIDYDITPYLKVRDKALIMPNGMRIEYPFLRETNGKFAYISDTRGYAKAVADRVIDGTHNTFEKYWTKIYGAKFVENIIQALARIIVTDQMAIISKRYRVVLTVHDEIVALVPEHEAEEAKQFITKVMSMPPSWAPDLPVSCDVGIGRNYGDAKQ